MFYLVVRVPENTIPYKCGERYMACTFKEVEGEIKDGKPVAALEKCNDFFKTVEEADSYIKENPQYIWKKGEK